MVKTFVVRASERANALVPPRRDATRGKGRHALERLDRIGLDWIGLDWIGIDALSEVSDSSSRRGGLD
jgi:hypothetical protein